MDRIIEVKVNGNHISKDNRTAGVRGEANVTGLRVTFDESWDSYAKTVTFWDSRGENPVERTLTTDRLENAVESMRVYIIPIPAEPMAEMGMFTFVIDGYIDGKRKRSISDEFEVKYAPIADNAGEPADPNPSQAEQLQTQIDSIVDTIHEASVARAGAETARDEAVTAKDRAEIHAKDAEGYADRAEGLSVATQGYVLEAEEYANKAEGAIGKTSYIGTNGNWYAWDSAKGEFYDTGVKAQSGSTVYLGDNPPADADVWIYPDGEGDIIDQMQRDITSLKETINTLYAKSLVRTVYINLPASSWTKEDDSQHYQVVSVDGITEYSKIDLQPTLEQLVVFYEKDITFVAVNNGGTVYVYCIGQQPANNYTLQATVTEVMANG